MVDELERRLCKSLDALGPAPRAELLRVLTLPDLERAERIGEFWSYPQEPRLRRASDRLRGGPDVRAVLVPDAAGGGAGTAGGSRLPIRPVAS
jgi:hypothetical protein